MFFKDCDKVIYILATRAQREYARLAGVGYIGDDYCSSFDCQ